MNIRNILNSSVKPTILTIASSITLSVIFSMIILYMNRLAWSENQAAPSAAFYFTHNNLALGFTYKIIGDLSVITRYIAELGVILLIAQLIYRVFKRSKSS